MKKVLSLVLIVSAATILSACNPLSKPEKAGLQVITNDINSTVYLNDNYLEKTPLIKRDLKPGTYTIKIQPDDPEYVPYETTITLREGLLAVVTWKPGTRTELSGGVIFEMEPIKQKNNAEVSVVSIPDGAIVTLGDSEKEFTPYIFQNLSPMQADLEITLPSYETQRHTIDIVPGHRLLINVKLAKAATALENTADSQTDTQNTNLDEPNAATESAQTDPQTNDPSSRETSLQEQATSSATTTAGPTTGPRVLIESTNFFNNGTEVLRVRNAPGSTGAQLGFAEVGQYYQYLEETNGGWYKISFEGQEGWVSGEYATLEE